MNYNFHSLREQTFNLVQSLTTKGRRGQQQQQFQRQTLLELTLCIPPYQFTPGSILFSHYMKQSISCTVECEKQTASSPPQPHVARSESMCPTPTRFLNTCFYIVLICVDLLRKRCAINVPYHHLIPTFPSWVLITGI